MYTQLFAASTLLCLSTVGMAQSEVFVYRDGHGVAHSMSTSTEGAFYGAGRAHAEDRLFQMVVTRLAYQGRLAEYLGAGPDDAHLESDRFHRLAGTARRAQAQVDAMTQAERDVMDAFAAGVSDHMQAVREGNAPRNELFDLNEVPLGAAWTAQDCVGVWLRLCLLESPPDWLEINRRRDWDDHSELTGAALVEEVLGERLCDDAAAVVTEAEFLGNPNYPANLVADMQAYATAMGLSTLANCALFVPDEDAPHFSHSWALGEARVAEGVSMLIADPRLPVQLPNILYEWRMESPDFNVQGAGAPGAPFMLVGSNQRVAWGGSGLGGDASDLFLMDADLQADPPTYQFDFLDSQGPQTVEMDPVEAEEIKIKDSASEWVVYRETRFGPIVTEAAPDGIDVDDDEWAMRISPFGFSNRTTIRGYLGYYEADTVEELRAASANVDAPIINLVFADIDGHIGYTAQGACVTRAANQVLAGMAALDGDTAANEWQELLPLDYKPWVIDPESGVLFTANHMPIGSYYPLPFVSNARGETERSLRLRAVFDEPGTFTVQDVYDVHLDMVHEPARAVTRIALELQAQEPSFPGTLAASRALGHLEDWLQAGATMTGDLPGTLLASVMRVRFVENTTCSPGPLVDVWGGKTLAFLRELIERLESPGGLVLTPAEEPEIEEAIACLLAQAWSDAIAEGGSPASGWPAYYQATYLADVYTEAVGGVPPGELFGGIFLQGIDALEHAPATCIDVDTIISQSGQSYTFVSIPGFPLRFSVLTPGVREPGYAPETVPEDPTVGGGTTIDLNQEIFWSTGSAQEAFELSKALPSTFNTLIYSGVAQPIESNEYTYP